MSLLHYEERAVGRRLWSEEVSAASTGKKDTGVDRPRSPYVFKAYAEPAGQQGRWLDLIQEFDMDVEHRLGRVHSNSDALSHRPCEREDPEPCQQCLRGTTSGRSAGRGPPIGRCTMMMKIWIRSLYPA